MSDLEKLARWHEELAGYNTFDHTAAAATIRAAMGDNERLREAFEKEAAAHFQYRCGNMTLALEIERLRNALVEIAGLTHRRQLPITAQIHEVALAALGKGERP